MMDNMTFAENFKKELEKLTLTEILERYVLIPSDTAIKADQLLHDYRDMQSELTALRAELEQAKRERDADRWIPVEERMPPKNVEVLVSLSDRVYRAEYMPHIQLPDYPWVLTERGRERMYRKDFTPTHWRPLPQPPQEATDAETETHQHPRLCRAAGTVSQGAA